MQLLANQFPGLLAGQTTSASRCAPPNPYAWLTRWQAFVISHDSVLIEMARVRPKASEDLRLIPGVGPAKAARFGAIFLAVIANHGDDS
jgi:hypothetical protein